MVDSPANFPTTSDSNRSELSALTIAVNRDIKGNIIDTGIVSKFPAKSTKFGLKRPIVDPRSIESMDDAAIDPNFNVTSIRAGKINPIDNVLNQYDSYTYKWTFYLADPVLHNGPDRTDTFKDGTIIAESGNSGRFFIESVNLEQLISINSITRNMPFTKINFTIVEPKGIGFMDNLLKATRHLNIPNHIKAPYYLQLDFWAWKDGVEVLVAEASRKWSIQIFTMSTSVKADGSTYVFDAVAADDIGTMNHTAITPFTIRIDKAITIAHFFEQYELAINGYNNLYKGILYQHADKVSFNLSDDIKDLKFGGETTDSQRNASTLTTNNDEKIVNVPKGFDLSTLVENLMVATPEWEPNIQMPVTGSRTIKRTDFTKVWTVETEVEYLEYDVRRQDYARHYIFNIKPIKLMRSAGDVDRGDIQFQKGRFTKLIEEFEIKKLYHYIFTGLNTEVLNFDMDLALMWYSEMPMSLGQNTGDSQIGGGAVSQTPGATLPRTRAIVERDLIRATNDLKAITDKGIEDFSFDQGRDAAKAAGTQVNVLREEFKSFTTVTDILSDQINTGRNIRRGITPRFIEDIDKVNTTNSFKMSDVPELNTGAIVYSLRYDPGREDKTKEFAIPGVSTGNRAFMATYLNYYVNAEMVELNLEIRGDPWWIQRGKFERRSLGKTIVPENDISDDTAMDPTYRDHMLILNMKSPKPENPDGFYDVEDNELYTGIYQIYRIENIFEGGLFTQKLTGIKDALTDLRVLREWL